MVRLDRETEIRLVQSMHDGDARARNELLLSQEPHMRGIAGKYAAAGVDSLDAFVSEGMLALARVIDRFDPDRAGLSTFARPWLVEAMARHAKYLTTPHRSIHEVTSTECIREWRTEPEAEEYAARAEDLYRTRKRLSKAMERQLQPVERAILRARFRDERVQTDVGGMLGGVSKQAVSVRERAALGKLRVHHYDKDEAPKDVQLRLYLCRSDVERARAAGLALTVAARVAAKSPEVVGGTDVAIPFRTRTRVTGDIAATLHEAAVAHCVTASHLVRASIRREVRERLLSVE